MNELTARNGVDISTWRVVQAGEQMTAECYARSIANGLFDPLHPAIVGLTIPSCFRDIIIAPTEPKAEWTADQILERES